MPANSLDRPETPASGPLAHKWFGQIASLPVLLQVAVDHVFYKLPIVYIFTLYVNWWEEKKDLLQLANTQFWGPPGQWWKGLWWTTGKVWPPIQLLNFAFVPVEYRVLVLNSSLYVWSCYLAWYIRVTQNSKKKQLEGRGK